MKLKYRLKEIVLVEGNLAQTCAQIDNNSASFVTTLIKWFLVTRQVNELPQKARSLTPQTHLIKVTRLQ